MPPRRSATGISHLPPTAALFAAFLGYNPLGTLLPPYALRAVCQRRAGRACSAQRFFPSLIASPFMVGLHAVFYLSAGMCVIGAVASLLRGHRAIYGQDALAVGAVAAAGALTGAVASNTVLEPAAPEHTPAVE